MADLTGLDRMLLGLAARRAEPRAHLNGHAHGSNLPAMASLAQPGIDRNNALTAWKGAFVQLGMDEAMANWQIVNVINPMLAAPLDTSELEETVLQRKGWEPGLPPHEAAAFAAQLAPPPPAPAAEAAAPPPEPIPADVIQEARRQWARSEATRLLTPRPEVPRAQTLEEIRGAPRPPVIIEGLLTEGVYLLGGPSEAGKSLLGIQWVFAVAGGRTWNGYPVPGGQRKLAGYVAGEGFYDLEDRFQALADAGYDEQLVRIHEGAITLADPTSTGAFCDLYEAESRAVGAGVGMLMFDTVYDMGMADDNGVKDVLQVLNGAKALAARLHCAVVLLGHTPHDESVRRFRGSSMWRQRAEGEFHMADGRFDCQKLKWADKRVISHSYTIEWPFLRLGPADSAAGALNIAALAQHTTEAMERIRAAVLLQPDATATAIARELAGTGGWGERHIRRMVTDMRREAAAPRA